VVIARLSSFYFKGKNEDIREIGKKLNASYILAGSVRKEENLYRVVVELINAATGRTIYSEPYNYESKRIISLESDIAVNVAQKIKSKLSISDKQQVTDKKDVNPEAYEAYLKGRMEFNKGPIPVNNQINAKKYFQSAVDLDPGFAEAYAFLSFSYVNLSQYSYTLKEKRIKLDSVKYWAGKAIELNENNYMAHLAMSNIYWPDHDLVNFMKEINKAYEIDPVGAKNAKAMNMILFDKEDDEGIRLAKEGAISDPLNTDLLTTYSYILEITGRYDESIGINNQVLALEPNNWNAHAMIGWCYLFKKEIKPGLQEWSKCMLGYGKPDLAELFLTTDFKTSMEAFFKWQLAENEGTIPNKYGGFAWVYSYLGDRENTLKYLDLAYKNNEDLTSLKRWPGMDFLRKDPAFLAIYEKAGFKAYDEYKATLKKK
jgi:adenylate cyclase